MGVCPNTLLNWEKDYIKPKVVCWPAIIRFLGYDPNPTPTDLGERMKAKRRQMGWTLLEASKTAGMDEGTWRNVESGVRAVTSRIRSTLEMLLDR